MWINVLNPVLETWVSASFRGEGVIFYPGSFVLALNPAPRAAFPLKLLLFFSSQETCLLVTWMISSRKRLKGPPTLSPLADPLTIRPLLLTTCQHPH